jgi:hypothetical protein
MSFDLVESVGTSCTQGNLLTMINGQYGDFPDRFREQSIRSVHPWSPERGEGHPASG